MLRRPSQDYRSARRNLVRVRGIHDWRKLPRQDDGHGLRVYLLPPKTRVVSRNVLSRAVRRLRDALKRG